MASLSAGPTALCRRLALPVTTPSHTYIVLYFLLCFLSGYYIIYILDYKYISLTNTSLFCSTTFAKYFISYSKDTYFGRQKGHFIGYSLCTLC